MTARQIIVVDIETSGLDPARHSPVEVAWWNLATDERGLFVPSHHIATVLSLASVKALQLNRYIDRIVDQDQDQDSREVRRLHDQFVSFDEDQVHEETGAELTRHTLAGANPAFDAAFLAVLFGNVDPDCGLDERPWHHRLWDVSAYAAGVLGLDELPGLSTVCELLDVPPPDHTSEGDVTATGLCFRELQKRAAR